MHAYGRRAAATGRYPCVSIDSPKIYHVCKGCGVEAERVQEPGRLGAALARCLALSSADGRTSST